MSKHSGKSTIELKTEALSSQELDELAQEVPLLISWIAAITDEVERRLRAGESFNYATLRDKRAIRKWEGEVSDIIKVLTRYLPLEEVAPRVPLSPTKVEEILGLVKFESLAHYVQKISSGQTVGFVNPGKPFS